MTFDEQDKVPDNEAVMPYENMHWSQLKKLLAERGGGEYVNKDSAVAFLIGNAQHGDEQDKAPDVAPTASGSAQNTVDDDPETLVDVDGSVPCFEKDGDHEQIFSIAGSYFVQSGNRFNLNGCYLGKEDG